MLLTVILIIGCVIPLVLVLTFIIWFTIFIIRNCSGHNVDEYTKTNLGNHTREHHSSVSSTDAIITLTSSDIDLDLGDRCYVNHLLDGSAAGVYSPDVAAVHEYTALADNAKNYFGEHFQLYPSLPPRYSQVLKEDLEIS